MYKFKQNAARICGQINKIRKLHAKTTDKYKYAQGSQRRSTSKISALCHQYFKYKIFVEFDTKYYRVKIFVRKCKNLGTLWAYSETVFVFGCMPVCLQATCDVDFTHRWNKIIVLLVTLVLLIYIYHLFLFKIFLFDTCIYSLHFAQKYYNYKNWKLNGLIK